MKHNAGRFRPGYDPRRHRFTREECQAGFWAALESIAARYPKAYDASGAHMVKHFLAAVQAKRENTTIRF